MKQEPYDEASARREFKRSTKLQAEFGDEATYLGYCRGAASGRIAPLSKLTVSGPWWRMRSAVYSLTPVMRAQSWSAA